jgi:hypothetical protein
MLEKKFLSPFIAFPTHHFKDVIFYIAFPIGGFVVDFFPLITIPLSTISSNSLVDEIVVSFS